MNPQAWFDQNGPPLIARCREVFGKAARPERFVRHDEGCEECQTWQDFFVSTPLENLKSEEFYNWGSPHDALAPGACRYLLPALVAFTFSTAGEELIDEFMLWGFGDPFWPAVRDFDIAEARFMRDLWECLVRSYGDLREWERPFDPVLEDRIRAAAGGWQERVRALAHPGTNPG